MKEEYEYDLYEKWKRDIKEGTTKIRGDASRLHEAAPLP